MSSNSVVEVSAHAYLRAKERLSWKPNTVDKMALRAWVSGFTLKELKGGLKKWVKGKSDFYVASQYRLYGEYLYIFGFSLGTATLITVYNIPTEYLGMIPRLKQSAD